MDLSKPTILDTNFLLMWSNCISKVHWRSGLPLDSGAHSSMHSWKGPHTHSVYAAMTWMELYTCMRGMNRLQLCSLTMCQVVLDTSNVWPQNCFLCLKPLTNA